MDNENQKSVSMERIVPDTSVIIEGLLSKKISKDEIKTKEVILHEAVLAELEHQANQNKAKGFLGLDELDRLREMSEKKHFELQFSGKKPSAAEIKKGIP